MPTIKACPHWQQIVAENGNKLLLFSATICCRFRQQFVAEIGNKLLPVASVDRPLYSGQSP